jgi:sugar transferase (PEP-CTERM/EpsH1 system associated)
MNEIVFLTHRIPYPPNKGDKIRSHRFLTALSERYAVHLGTFIDDESDWAHLDAVKARCRTTCFAPLRPAAARIRALPALLNGRPLSVAYYDRPELRRWVEETVRERKPRCIFVFSSAMAQFVPEQAGVRRVIDFCDVDSAKWDQYATSTAWPQSLVYRREGRRLADFERSVASAFDASLFISDAEARLFAQRAGCDVKSLTVVRNGVDCDFFAPNLGTKSPFPAGPAPIVFTGAMDYWANVDAVTDFARNVLPLVRAQCAQASFWIVGSKPTRDVHALAAIEGVQVTGSVPETRPYLEHAAVVVAPLRIARGVQNKVLESLAMGRATVATTHVLKGFDRSEVPGLRIADAPADMAAHVLELIRSPELAQRLGAEGRDFVCEQFGWQRNLDTLLAVLDGEQRAA